MFESRSGVVIDGKELTRTQVRAGKREITAMTATVKPGDITSFDTSVTTTSPMSASFKQSIQELKDAEAKMEKDSDAFDIETAMSNILLDKAKRDKARQQFEAFDKVTFAYIDSEIKSIANLSDIVQKVEPGSMSLFLQVASRLRTIRAGYENTRNARTKLIDFLEKNPHTTTGGLAVFDTDSQVKAYNALSDQFVKVSDEFVKASQTSAN